MMGSIFGVTFFKLLDIGSSRLSPALANAVPAISYTVGASLNHILFGLVLILFLVFEPRGLNHRWATFKASYRLWPFSS